MQAKTYTQGSVTLTLTEWAKSTGIPRHVLVKRISVLGWPVYKALSTPVRSRDGVQKNKYGYSVQITVAGQRKCLSGFLTKKAALQARQTITSLPSGQPVDLNALITPLNPTARATYTVNNVTGTLADHLRVINLPRRSFYNLREYTDLPPERLLHLLTVDRLTPKEIRDRFRKNPPTST